MSEKNIKTSINYYFKSTLVIFKYINTRIIVTYKTIIESETF